MNRWLLLISVLALAVVPAGAQDQKVIGLQAESFKARQVDGRTIVDLVSPILTQDDSVLSSDFGIDEGNGFVRFWGHVQIAEKEDTLRAERIRYNQDTKIGVAEGNVFMTDGVAVLKAPFATHFSDEDRTEFENGVEYSDSSGVLSALQAVYYSGPNEARFVGQVRLHQDDVFVYADSIAYERENDISEAWGKVLVEQLTDTTSTYILSEYLYRNARVDSIFVEGRPRLASIDLVESDTVLVAASRMVLFDEPHRTSVSAVDSVVVSASGYALRGDSLSTLDYADGFRSNRIYGKPIAWLERTQVSADSLIFTSRPSSADSLFGIGNVFVASEDSSSGRIQQLKGRVMRAVMERDSLRTLILEDNAEALFYTRETDDDPLTAVRASADGVVFQFEDGEPSDVRFYEGVEGTYYAENLLDKLLNLSGFAWNPELMPDRSVLSGSFWAEVQLRRQTGKQ
jgi:lipopolysaccharide export system protein LptA